MSDRRREQLLREPKSGSACAAAREFGIDLTLTIEQLRLTPEERLRKLGEFREGIRNILASARVVRSQ